MRTEYIQKAVKSDEFLSYLHAFDAHVGDTYHIPAGVIHALGAGTKVYEVSTASERTFRIYDYGRGRELHLEDAMKVLRFDEVGCDKDLKKVHKLLHKERGFEEYLLLRGEHFQLRRIKVHGNVKISTEGRPWVVTCVQGRVTLKSKANVTESAPPDTVVVPACVEEFRLEGKGEVVCAHFNDV
jgi:mannose-6-phosphate isomerase